jgi:lipopolysaccharide transport system ATP-binding protein
VISSGDRVTIRIRAIFRERRAHPMVGILIRNRIGMDIYGTNTGIFEAGEEMEIDFTFECWLTPQQYTVTVATQHPDGSSHDWLDDVITFDVVSRRVAAGVADLRATIECRKTAAKIS